ncbi:MAG TPA: thioredoxin-disulfide reductase [Candidatus Latescibacteria bacterium]|nr:thioredoxin-disulfide reductase [Candidatus Latescibacterota bacterium]
MEAKIEDIGVILPEAEELTRPAVDEAKVYELVIIGGGPAGLTAAVYSARKRIDTLLVTKDIGGQVLLTSDVENYMGYYYITGKELIEKFKHQVRQYPIAIKENAEVIRIGKEDKTFTVETSGGGSYRTKAVIIASGKRSRPLNVKGEKELVGRGVTYCSVCDAPLFTGLDVTVIGGGNSGLTAVVDLVKIANKIYLIESLSSLKADPLLVERADRSGKVEKFLGYEVMEILGETRVSGIKIKSTQTGEIQTLAVQGVFIEIGLIPNSGFAKGVVELNGWGEIVVDCACRTNVPGIFAAGDVTTVPEKQIVVAAGEGAKAALSAYGYLLGES